MTRIFVRLAAAATIAFAPQVFAAPPSAPVVTSGAGYKQLRFDAAPVAGANYYQLWFRANGSAGWINYAQTTAFDPLFIVTVSAHLLDWYNARYRVAACNTTGCTNSADIYVTGLMRDTVGYFKPRAAALEMRRYGYDSSLSADGRTLVVLTAETVGIRANSVRAYVYRMGNSGWKEEARLQPAPTEQDTSIGLRQVAINADGTVIALGVPREYFPDRQGAPAGAVYVFRRTGTVWQTEKKIAFHDARSFELGRVVDLDDSGDTLAIWRSFTDTDVPDEYENHDPIEIYRHSAAGWTPSGLINTRDDVCESFALSGDGKVIAQTCDEATGTVKVYEAPDWGLRQTLNRGNGYYPAVDLNHDGSLIVAATETTTPAPAGATWRPWLTVFRRGTAGWQADPAFTHIGSATPNPPTGISLSYAMKIAMSRDGRFVAVSDAYSRHAGVGVLHPPVSVTTAQTGAVFIYEKKATAWSLRNMIKPNVAVPNGAFGTSLAFGDDGKILLVGSPLEDSGAHGIDGDQTDTSAPDSGAVWLY